MNREAYIRDLAFNYLSCGPSARWDTAGDEERLAAGVLIDLVIEDIRIPPRAPIFVEPPLDPKIAAEQISTAWAS